MSFSNKVTICKIQNQNPLIKKKILFKKHEILLVGKTFKKQNVLVKKAKFFWKKQTPLRFFKK